MRSFESLVTVKQDIERKHAVLSKLQKQNDILARRNDNTRLQEQVHRVTNAIKLLRNEIVDLKGEKKALNGQLEFLASEYNYENITGEVI